MVDPSILGIPWKRQLWHKWKAIRKIPFRRSWFIGYDLEGNSYWELVDHNNPSRLRRKVSLDKPYFHFSDFKPHPQWMQWLQFTRPAPPTLSDLTEDAKRQMRLKILAKHAEEKWRSVPLKSGQTDKSEDPRIGSAWSGAAAETVHPEATAEEPGPHLQTQGGGSTNEGTSILSAMQEAELRRQQEPKVYRDHLGQVKTRRQDSSGNSENKAPTGAESNAEPNVGSNANASAKANVNAKDEPTTASFQPKGRV